MENYYTELYFGSLHILAGLVLFCSLLLWSQLDDGQRSRQFLAWTWLLLLLLYIGRLIIVYNNYLTFDGVLPIRMIIFGLVLVAVMTVYPIEVVSPRWLNRQRFLILFSPVILVFAVCGAIHFWGGGFRMLNTLDDIARYYHEPNVWIRFLIILLVYGYAFILYYIPQRRMQGNITLDWIRAYTLGNVGIGLFYMWLILCGVYPAGIFHTLYFTLYIGYITYQELYVRLFIPDNENSLHIVMTRRKKGTAAEKELWATLDNYMQKELAWHNPNLSISLLANALRANHTEVAKLLESMECSEFDDYVSEFRIREFCALVNSGDSITIEDTFFRVGFRYRDIATRQFMRIMRQSPEEYIRKGEAKAFKG